MTQMQLCKKVAEKSKCTATQCNEIMKALAEEIYDAVADGEKVKFGELGTFRLKRQSARTARNVKKGEVVFVPEKYKVVFSQAGNIAVEATEKAKKKLTAKANAKAKKTAKQEQSQAKDNEEQPVNQDKQ